MIRFQNILCGLLLSVVAAYAIPQQINYQGSLTGSSGTPLDTTVAITFNIWPVPAGGSPDWTESHSSVTVSDGLFHVLLGSVTTLPELFAANRWLGITIGGDTEMIPRQQIVSVAHAYRVGTVDGASGGTITSDVNINNKLNVGTGNTNTGSFANVLGENNIAFGDHAVIAGGKYNRARGQYSFLGGGGGATQADSNSAFADYSTVSGGHRNRAGGESASVGGGYLNLANGQDAVIAGGSTNTATGAASTVGGGYNNSASGFAATVGGGYVDTASGDRATVGGGYGNTASGDRATVGGGSDNTASQQWATVGGGNTNTASGQTSTVSGGFNNNVSGLNAVICGGNGNTVTVSGTEATVGGGTNNNVSANYATVVGGQANTASGENSCVFGGDFNTASGYAAMCSGGGNTATGNFSFVAGGQSNEATGTNSFAAGRNSHATLTGSFVWGDGWGTNLTSTANDQFSVRASGGYRLYTNNNHTSGVTMAAGGNAWVIVSDSTKKRNIKLSDTKSVLNKFATLPIKDWEYKSEQTGIAHVGPMAQDFWNSFHLGSDSLGIATNDADGVLFAAVQELAKEVTRLQARVQTLEAEKKQTMKIGSRKEEKP